jgi:hypothetical protein
MVERAIKLRDAIELYCNHFKSDEACPLSAEDILSNDDWLELSEILQLLTPVKKAQKVVQSAGSYYGSLWLALASLEFLLDTLETAKQKYQHLPNTHLKAMINLGWKKLRKYYVLSDKTAAYRAAIALHPHYKMRWFKRNWSDMTDDKTGESWVELAREAIEGLYEEYERRYSDSEAAAIAALRKQQDSQKELDDFERSLCMDSDDNNDVQEELQRYLQEPVAPYGTDPVHWWQANHLRYPILRHMAFDLLAAPSSSAAAERQFSIAGHVLNEDRYLTKADLAEANQCLKNWFQEGLIPTAVVTAAAAIGDENESDTELSEPKQSPPRPTAVDTALG